MATKDKKTLIVITVDESSSMQHHMYTTMSAYNEFLTGQRANTETKAYLSLIKFSSTAQIVHGVLPIKDVKNLDPMNYRPHGTTALYDSVNLAIETADAQVDLFDQIIIVIMTDGEENASRTATLPTIRTKVSEREASEKWTFVYIGENPAKWALDTGMPVGNTMTYEPGREIEQMQALQGGINNARSALQSGDVTAQRQAKKSFFTAYLQREGPKNLGAIQWPAAKPGVLTGQKFLLTGVLETITYETCVQLIKDCGGQLMTVVSPKLNYLIVGREAGPVKLKTAKEKKVSQIDEQGFFKYLTDLINNVGAGAFGTPTLMTPSDAQVDTILANPPPNWSPHQKSLATAAAVAVGKPPGGTKRAGTNPAGNVSGGKKPKSTVASAESDEESEEEGHASSAKTSRAAKAQGKTVGGIGASKKKPQPKKAPPKKVPLKKSQPKTALKKKPPPKTTPKKKAPPKTMPKKKAPPKTTPKKKAPPKKITKKKAPRQKSPGKNTRSKAKK